MTPLRRSALLLLLAAACGEEGGVSSDPGTHFVLQKGTPSGDGQSAGVATLLPAPIRVLITSDGAPVAGSVVTFTPVAGGGTAVPAVDTTDAEGIASTQWTLATTAGGAALLVASSGAGGSPLTFHATALPGAPAAVFPDSGDGQFQEPELEFARPLRVRVIDGFGNGIPGVNVSWGVAAGSGSVGPLLSLTDVAGRAVSSAQAGEVPGPLAIRATIAQVPGDTAAFGLIVTPVAAVVTISNNFFTPAALTIAAGGAVRWSWNAGTHNLAQVDGPPDFRGAPTLSAGASFGPVLFTTPGVYDYECSLHTGMLGSITVQ